MLENGAHTMVSQFDQFDHQLSYSCDACSEFCFFSSASLLSLFL